ncbi:hypothetical protein D3C86_1551910 [compost metagenome]
MTCRHVEKPGCSKVEGKGHERYLWRHLYHAVFCRQYQKASPNNDYKAHQMRPCYRILVSLITLCRYTVSTLFYWIRIPKKTKLRLYTI